MPASNDVRHAVSRSTGATTWTRKEADGWKSTCLNHKAETTAPNRGVEERLDPGAVLLGL